MEVCVKCNKELPENNPLCPNCGFRNLSLTDTKYDNSKKLILVEGDSFTMGSDTGLDIEKPSHPVTVSSFYISKYAVTQTEWIEIMDNNPSDIEGDLFPVENISWLDAILYCNKRSIKENLEPCYLINCDEALDEYDMKSSKLQNMLQKFGWKSLEVLCDFDKNGYRLPTEADRKSVV